MSSESKRELAYWFGEKAEDYAEEERGVACLNGTVDGELRSSALAVEVKGCIIIYPSGRCGRLRFWKRQHEKVKEADGVYLVIVYDVEEREPVQYDRFVHWSSLEAIMEEYDYSWYDAREHSMSSQQTQIPWKRFFPEISE